MKEEIKLKLGDKVTCKTIKLKNGKFIQKSGRVSAINKEVREVLIIHPAYSSRVPLHSIIEINGRRLKPTETIEV